MKNYVKNGQKLPIFGVGPYIVCIIVMLTAIGVFYFCYIKQAGLLGNQWNIVFRGMGIALIVTGSVIWYIGALKSGMDENIQDNKLKTDGIYAWVRNPMYSGWWFIITGISLMWVNLFLLFIVPVNWIIMTVILKNTEEKWLSDLYGDRYELYKRRVNRLIPWIPKAE